jgi:response regulator RpfG family c-di-GMP phosphodiesterase
VYRAGVLALFSAITASVVTFAKLPAITAGSPPLAVGLAVLVWAAALGLTAMLIGALSDDRLKKIQELHEAYVGVVEVLSQYLQSANPQLKAQTLRVAELSGKVAEAIGLSGREIDDIRVAALLYNVGNIEVTARVIHRAAAACESEPLGSGQCTFQGTELMLSLTSVLRGAVPLLLNQEREASSPSGFVPIGAKIIRLARAYVAATRAASGDRRPAAADILRRLGADLQHDHDLVAALKRAVAQDEPCEDPEPESLAEV